MYNKCGNMYGVTSKTKYVCYVFFTTHCSLRLIVQFELDVPTFATRRLHAYHHARAPAGGKWNFGLEMSGNFA
jgi:sterol desaturase/sphingolipid hydroxylase (fatty acid hydroxylase superfamily)